MGDKPAPSKAFTTSTRSRSDWKNNTKDVPKRRRGAKQASDSEEEEDDDEEENEEDEEDEEEEADGGEDDSETGTESERERPKLTTRQSAVKKAKDEDKRRKQDKGNPRRRGTDTTKASDDGSETTSPNATDDEMNGRSNEKSKNTKTEGTSSVTTATTEGGTSERKPDHEHNGREHNDDRYRERDVDRERTRERHSSMTLPSLSRAAMMHMNQGETRRDDPTPNGYSADPSNRGAGWRRDRSRSRSRERGDHSREGGDNNRWNESNQSKENGRGSADENMSNYSGDGGRGQRDDDPTSPGNDGQDVRIMFHGREIYADDLIGLRVAKTFVGHGRFLGQVVKFDEPTSLYTIVYADGDAEELSIENTIQILIQDEIERADPAVPPVPMAFRNDRIPDSPEAGSVTPASSTTTVSVPVAPLNPAAIPPPQQQPPQPPVYPSRRSGMNFTDREAQFVMGMFENNALPVLLRQGWRVQHDEAGRERRFYAPQGNFRGAGHVFLSAFDVVELIVFDNELLSACFPQNMHSVILSLFPDSGATATSRKRGSPAVPPEGPSDTYDSKRVRGGGRDSGYPGGPAGVAPMVRAGGPGGSSMGLAPPRGDERLVPPMSYADRERDRVERSDHDSYGAPQRITPLGPGDRFPPNASIRSTPPDNYRRPGGEDYRTMPLRPMPSDSAPGAPSSRWAGPVPSGGGQDPSEFHHRRAYSESAEWSDRDPMAGRGGPPLSSSGSYMGSGRPSSGSNHRGDEPNRGGGVYYGGDRGVPRGGPGMGRPGGPPMGPSGGLGESASSYGRYRDSRGPPPPSSAGQYSPEAFSNRYPSTRGEGPGQDYRGPSPGGPSGMADRFARPLSRGGSAGPGGPSGPPSGGGGGRGFSMMDVDRNATGAGGGYDHRLERGRSPHLGGDGSGPPPGSSSSYGGPPSHMQHYGHHQRSASNGGPNPAEDSRTI